MLQGADSWEDIDIFFSDFAIDASLEIKKSNKTLNIKGIFDTPYMKRVFGSFIVDSEDPSFTCKWLPEFSDIRAGDVLTIQNVKTVENVQTVQGIDYFLQSAPESDGTGVCALILVPASTQDDEGDPDPEPDTNKPTDLLPDDPETPEDESVDKGFDLYKP